jgi:hypothetical protein
MGRVRDWRRIGIKILILEGDKILERITWGIPGRRKNIEIWGSTKRSHEGQQRTGS